MKKNNTRTQNPRGRKTVPQSITIGIDLGDKTSRWCALIDDEVREGTVATNRKAIIALFGKLPRCRVAIEVGAHSRWVDRLLRELGHEVYVANARQVKLITESSRKDDRLDAQTLARLARADPQLLRPVRHRSDEAQAGVDRDSSARGAGRGAYRAGELGARPGQVVWRAAAEMRRRSDVAGAGPGAAGKATRNAAAVMGASGGADRKH